MTDTDTIRQIDKTLDVLRLVEKAMNAEAEMNATKHMSSTVRPVPGLRAPVVGIPQPAQVRPVRPMVRTHPTLSPLRRTHVSILERLSILGLCGYAGAGKDYIYSRLADIVPAELGRPVVRVAFADELRLELDEVLGLPSGNSVLWQKPYPDPIRWLLQHYGTEYRRAQDPDYWVNLGMEHAETILDRDPDTLIVVTDVRFANEADAIKAHRGGGVALVHASEATRVARLGGKRTPVHASEVIDFPVDWVIQNDVSGYLPAELAAAIGFDREPTSLAPRETTPSQRCRCPAGCHGSHRSHV